MKFVRQASMTATQLTWHLTSIYDPHIRSQQLQQEQDSWDSILAETNVTLTNEWIFRTYQLYVILDSGATKIISLTQEYHLWSVPLTRFSLQLL